MLQTIEVHIDDNGNIFPTEPLPTSFQGRALLTLLNSYIEIPTPLTPNSDRFDKARGCATIKWETDDLMRLLRGND